MPKGQRGGANRGVATDKQLSLNEELSRLARAIRVAWGMGNRERAHRLFEDLKALQEHRDLSWVRAAADRSKMRDKDEMVRDIMSILHMEVWAHLVASSESAWEDRYLACHIYERSNALETFLRNEGISRSYRSGKCEWIVTHKHMTPFSVLEAEGDVIGDAPPDWWHPGDPRAADAFELADYADVFVLLDRLPDHERDALNLRYFADLKHEEIGAALGKTERTVRTWQKEGITKLRTWYRDGTFARSNGEDACEHEPEMREEAIA